MKSFIEASFVNINMWYDQGMNYHKHKSGRTIQVNSDSDGENMMRSVGMKQVVNIFRFMFSLEMCLPISVVRLSLYSRHTAVFDYGNYVTPHQVTCAGLHLVSRHYVYHSLIVRQSLWHHSSYASHSTYDSQPSMQITEVVTQVNVLCTQWWRQRNWTLCIYCENTTLRATIS